jgi:hypothetical protein
MSASPTTRRAGEHRGISWKKQLVVATPARDRHRSYPKALNDILGTKFGIVGVIRRPPTFFWRWSAAKCRASASLDSIKVPAGLDPTKTISILFQGGTKPVRN